jgi:hypothetical protein
LRQQSPARGLRIEIVDNRRSAEAADHQSTTSIDPRTSPNGMSTQSASEFSHRHSGEYGHVEIKNKSSSTACSIKHRIENTESDGTGSGSDEDILHVVTNVYTIPINNSGCGAKPIIANVKGESSEQLVNSNSSIGVRISNCPNSLLYQPIPIIQNRTLSETSGSKDTCHVFQRVVNTNCAEPCPDVTKSKFQIRSIVEIYESDNPPPSLTSPVSQQSAQQDLGYYKTSTQVNETTTKEFIALPKVKGKIKRQECPNNSHTHNFILCTHASLLSNKKRFFLLAQTFSNSQMLILNKLLYYFSTIMSILTLMFICLNHENFWYLNKLFLMHVSKNIGKVKILLFFQVICFEFSRIHGFCLH